MLRCPAPEASRIWSQNISHVSRELIRLRTAPTITTAIVKNLVAWRTGSAPFLPESDQWGERQAVEQQHRMGWTNFVFGRWHQQWARAQQNYMQSQESKHSPRRWTAAIIHKLFMTAWDMWDHRNKVLHAPDGPRAIIEQAHLSAQITSEYNRGLEGLRPSDHYLLQDPLQSILSGTCSSQRKWLHSVHLARQLGPVDAAAIASAQLRRQQNLMRQWLQLPGLAPHVT